MPRQKKPKLVQVNALLLEEDIRAVKEMAQMELSTTWHPKLRQILHLGVVTARGQQGQRKRVIE